jgi:hypothetical protein
LRFVNAPRFSICKTAWAAAPSLPLPSMGVSSLDLGRRRKPCGPFFASAAGRCGSCSAIHPCALTIIIASAGRSRASVPTRYFGSHHGIAGGPHRPQSHLSNLARSKNVSTPSGDGDEAGYGFGLHAFVPGDTFRVIAADPPCSQSA